jgi:hypothetical protein
MNEKKYMKRKEIRIVLKMRGKKARTNGGEARCCDFYKDNESELCLNVKQRTVMKMAVFWDVAPCNLI